MCMPQSDHQLLTEAGWMSFAEFEANPRVLVACPRLSTIASDRARGVVGGIEFHAATKLINKSDTSLVHFKSEDTKDARAVRNEAVDFLVTGDHKMWASVGTPSQKHNFQWYPASELVNRNDAVVAEVQLPYATDGVLPTDATSDEVHVLTMPFVEPLGLTDADQCFAFLELYGYWLGEGSVDSTQEAVVYCPTKAKDEEWLEARFKRVGLVPLAQGGTGKLGYSVCNRADGVRIFHIVHPAWYKLFQDELQSSDMCASFPSSGIQSGESSKVVASSRPASASSSSSAAAAALVCVVGQEEGKLGATPEPEASSSSSAAAGSASAVSASHDEGKILAATAEDSKSAKCFWSWLFKRGYARRRALMHVLLGLACADGQSEDEDVDRCDSIAAFTHGHCSTASVRFRDEVERIATLAGFTVHSCKEGDVNGTKEAVPFIAGHDLWQVSWTKSEATLNSATEIKRVERPEGVPVWCVEVPTDEHLIIIRRVVDGQASRPVVVGNCNFTLFVTTDTYSQYYTELCNHAGQFFLRWRARRGCREGESAVHRHRQSKHPVTHAAVVFYSLLCFAPCSLCSAVNTQNVCNCSQGPKVPPLVIPYVNSPGPGQTIAEWNSQQSSSIPYRHLSEGAAEMGELTEEEMAHYAAQAMQQQQIEAAQQHAAMAAQAAAQQQQQAQQHYANYPQQSQQLQQQLQQHQQRPQQTASYAQQQQHDQPMG